MNLVGIVKGHERYVWIYPDDRALDAMRCFGRFAASEDLSLTWYDAAILSEKVREIGRRRNQEEISNGNQAK